MIRLPSRDKNWPLRKVPEEMSLKMNWNRPIIRTANVPADAGIVGGMTVIEGLENYFFKDDPAFDGATLTLYAPTGSREQIQALDAITISKTCFIESSWDYTIKLHLKLMPNDDAADELKIVEPDGTIVIGNIILYDSINNLTNYHDVDKDLMGQAHVANNGSPMWISSSKVYIRVLDALIYGSYDADTLGENTPYEGGFERELVNITTGMVKEINISSVVHKYLFILVPYNMPDITDIKANGVPQSGAWRDLAYDTQMFSNPNAVHPGTHKYKVYRTSMIVSGGPYQLTVTF